MRRKQLNPTVFNQNTLTVNKNKNSNYLLLSEGPTNCCLKIRIVMNTYRLDVKSTYNTKKFHVSNEFSHGGSHRDFHKKTELLKSAKRACGRRTLYRFKNMNAKTLIIFLVLLTDAM